MKSAHPTRGWDQLFDTLNEAKGYNYLARIGCTDIKFISRAKKGKVQTPDLRGLLGTTPVLCEVKTINVSDDEAKRLVGGGVGTTVRYLEQPFLDKLSSTIRTAATQLLAFDKGLMSRRIVYVVFNFDDRIHEYADEYQKQIEAFLGDAAFGRAKAGGSVGPAVHGAAHPASHAAAHTLTPLPLIVLSLVRTNDRRRSKHRRSCSLLVVELTNDEPVGCRSELPGEG